MMWLLLMSLLVHAATAVSNDAAVPFYSWNNTVDTLQYTLAFIVVLVAAHPLGLLFPKLFKLPLITGYLIIGIIAGPFVANLLSKELIDMLSPCVSGLALSFISFQAGQEIYLPELKPQLKQIFILLGTLYVTAMPILTSVHFLANNAFFYDDFTSTCQLGIALMFGSISVLGSPATVMAIKIELNSVGPFTNLMLGATMTAEFVVLVSFSIARIVCSVYCADLKVSVGNIIFTLAIVASNLLLGVLFGFVIILIFKIPGSTAGEHMDLHDPQSNIVTNSEASETVDAMPHLQHAYIEAIDEIKTRKLWTTTVSLYTKGFLWLLLGYLLYLATSAIGEATVASYGLSWEVRFEPLLVLIVASCLAGHYSLIRHDMHVILDTVAPYMFLAFFVITGAALKLDKVVNAMPLVSLYISLRFLSILIACYLGGRYLLKLPSKQYNHLWLTMTPQAGVALGLADEVKDLSTEPWAAEFAATIVAAVVINQILGPVLCAIGLKRAGESMYDRNVRRARAADNQSDPPETASSVQSYPPLHQSNDDARALLTPYKVKNAVVIGEDEVAFNIALELSLYGAQVSLPLVDKEQADKWHSLNETIVNRSLKRDLIQYKDTVNTRLQTVLPVEAMATADVLIFTGDTTRSMDDIRAIKAQCGAVQPRMIAIISDYTYSKELSDLGVLIIQPVLALANIATRMVLLEYQLAKSLSHEIGTTSNFATAASVMENEAGASLAKMRLDGRRLALSRSIVTHHSVNYDRLAEALAAVNLPMPPPPLRVSMFGTSAAGFDPFANRGEGMSAYEHFVVQDDSDGMEENVFNGQFVRRTPRFTVSPTPQCTNPYSLMRSRSSQSPGNSRFRLTSSRESVNRGESL